MEYHKTLDNAEPGRLVVLFSEKVMLGLGVIMKNRECFRHKYNKNDTEPFLKESSIYNICLLKKHWSTSITNFGYHDFCGDIYKWCYWTDYKMLTKGE